MALMEQVFLSQMFLSLPPPYSHPCSKDSLFSSNEDLGTLCDITSQTPLPVGKRLAIKLTVPFN